MYDTLHDGPRVEQLKLWGKGLRHLHVGERVGLPRGGLAPDATYAVVMRRGGFVHLVDGVDSMLRSHRCRSGPGGHRLWCSPRSSAPSGLLRLISTTDKVTCKRK